MAINTLVTIKDALTSFVAGHGQLQRIEFEAEDHKAPSITEGNEFPMLFVAPKSVRVDRAMNIHRLRIYVYARINDDRLDIIEDANDTSLILRDIAVWWNGYNQDSDIEILEGANGEFVSDRELDNLVGYYADFEFQIPSHGRCDVPVNITPITPVPCAEGTVNVNQSDGSLIEAVTVESGGTENFNVPFWIRNPLWPDLPVINVGDERFVGLYAVFENDADGNVIDIVLDVAGNDIDYGDGTTATSINGLNTHVYDYATITSSILQMPDGTNYKMVIVDIDLNNTRYILCTSNSLPRSRSLAGWLEITAAGSALETLRAGANPAQNNIRYCLYLESLIVKEMSPINTTNQSCQVARILTNLKVLEYPNLNELENVLSASFRYSGDIRDSNGQPLSFNNTNFSGSLTLTFSTSSITELGDFIFPNVTAQLQCFYNSKIQEIGDMDLSSINSLFFFFALSDLRKVGTITVGTNLTTIRLLADDCYNVRKLIFAGDMSSVTNTANAFDNTWNLQELILPLMQVGFDISDTAMSGTPLQDLFTSLGNANGAQTITLPNFTSGESTTIATNKGYTIAYS